MAARPAPSSRPWRLTIPKIDFQALVLIDRLGSDRTGRSRIREGADVREAFHEDDIGLRRLSP